MPTPVDIEHATALRRLTITWEDERVSKYAMGYLRAWCPCAGCQGHSDVVRYLGEHDVGANDIEEVGAYAIRITFSDGHDAGIYSWDWLDKICESREPVGPKRGAFIAGKYVADPD